MKKPLLKLLLILLIAYALLLLVAFLAQRKLIYLPEPLRADEPWSPGFSAQVVTFTSDGGVQVSGLYAPPPDERGPVLLIMHGNAGNIRSWSEQLRLYSERGYGGLLLDPRGYGLSEGSPSEEACIADGEAALAWLNAQGVPSARVVAHGISIGTGIAVPLAARHELRGLILQSPFTDLVSVAQRVFFFLPCGLLLRDRYRNIDIAPDVAEPTLVIHGTRDRTITPENGQQLARALGNLRRLALAEGYGHNDLLLWSDYWPAIEGFLKEVGG